MIILSILTLVLYFVPSIIAYERKHHSFLLILLVNVALGWSGIFWIVALVWSLTDPQVKPKAA